MAKKVKDYTSAANNRSFIPSKAIAWPENALWGTMDSSNLMALRKIPLMAGPFFGFYLYFCPVGFSPNLRITNKNILINQHDQ